MFYGVSGWATRVREMFFDGGYGVAGATLEKSFPTFSLSSFLSLMKEKRAKENQGARGTCQVCRVQEGAGVVFSEVGRVREEAGVVFSDGGERVIEVRKMFLGGGYGAAGATLGMYFPTFSLSSFLSLMKEKRAKENQGARGTCQVCRVQEGAGVVFSEVGRVREEADVVLSEVGRVRDGAGVVFSNWGGRAKKNPRQTS